MFARQSFRLAQPIKNNLRYSTAKPSSSGPNGYLIFGLGAVGIAAAAYAYLEPRNKLDPKNSLSKAVGQTSAKASFTGGDQGWIDLKLGSVEVVNHNTKKLRFELPEQDDVSGLKVASAILTKKKGPQDEKPVIRPYTPINDEDQRGYLDLLVKVYPNGPMSEHLHSMNPGQRLSFKGPIPKYPLEANKHNHVALIAGGTGITPMWQIIRAIFNNPEDKTKVTLVFGNVTEQDILLKKELNELENTYPQRFRAFYVLDKPPPEWTQNKGHINKELLKTVLPEPKSENIKVFVCGPPGFYKAISGTKISPKDQGPLEGILKELGYSENQVFKF
ncbi:MAG: NADH-cytochrome b5 reductase [Trizodia sp. TS-e1964]|nr:MAG: NADH-cytochrome b5 reductase [Trizodia sp. TS-e1964]